MTIDKQMSCDDPFDSLMPVKDARLRLENALQVVTESETIALISGHGRVLSSDIESPINVPSFTNSAMDGYAIAASSIPTDGHATLKVVGTVWAGRVYESAINEGQAVRIFTGGLMPEGSDTVVIQEHASLVDDVVTIDSAVVPQKNVRLAGEDVEVNQLVFRAGTELNAAELGVLASLGINEVSVYRRIKVAFFTTGDELRALDEHAGKTLEPGMLFDSNRYSLHSMLSGLNVDVIDLGIVPDTAEATRDVMQDAAQNADIIISSGGVSAGDADFVTQVFHELGHVEFWKIAMRPGRPLAFGNIGKAFFFGLPGNPVAVMVTFLQFVQPAIKRVMGMNASAPYTISARCQSKLRKSLGRVEYQRGVLSNDDNGNLIVTSTGKQGAGRISSMSSANCLIVIAADVDGVAPGDVVEVQPFKGLFA